MDTIDMQLSEQSDWDRKALEALAAVVPEVEDKRERAEQERRERGDRRLAEMVSNLLRVEVPGEAVSDGMLLVGGYRFCLQGGSPSLLRRCSLTGKYAPSLPLSDRDALADQLRAFKADCASDCPVRSGLVRQYVRGKLETSPICYAATCYDREEFELGWSFAINLWLLAGWAIALPFAIAAGLVWGVDAGIVTEMAIVVIGMLPILAVGAATWSWRGPRFTE